VDDADVWSIVCFFIDRHHRRGKVASTLLAAAVDHALQHGASIIEGYPLEPRPGERVENAFAYTGLTQMFTRQGFRVAARRGRKIVVRLER
jgi:GNAT superfamily N-acetyltransferase